MRFGLRCPVTWAPVALIGPFQHPPIRDSVDLDLCGDSNLMKYANDIGSCALVDFEVVES